MLKRNFHSKSSNLLKASVWKSFKSAWVLQSPVLANFLLPISHVLCEKIQFHEQKELVELFWTTEPSKQLIAIHLPHSTHLLPSLTLCWQWPGCLPIILIENQVEKFIFKGADLMAPGIVGDLPDVPVESIVGIACESTPTKVIGVGILKMTNPQFQSVRKGKAVDMIHFLGDKLWIHCGSPSPPPPATTTPAICETRSINVAPLSAPSDPPAAAPDPPAALPEPTLDPETASAIIMEAFLVSLVRVPVFPISASTFHSKHMQGVHKHLPWKSTPWKKVTTFLTQMAKTRVIVVKPCGPDLMLVSFDSAHALFDTVVLPAAKPAKRTHPHQTAHTTSPNTTPAAAAAAVDPVRVVEMYTVTEAVHAWFAASLACGSVHTFPECRRALLATVRPYMHGREVRVPRDLVGRHGVEGATVAVDALLGTLVAQMPRSHVLSHRPGEVVDGAHVPVQVCVQHRRRKKVTLVTQPKHSLVWHWDACVTELQTRCASAVTVVDKQTVQIQGDQTKVLKAWVQEQGFQNLVKFP